METVKLTDVLKKPELRKKIVNGIKAGKIFIYPTDTIYGIGCNAESAQSVEKISDMKGREERKTFSVIAPGKEWIWSHASISSVNKDLIDKMLPGPYTIIVTANTKSPKAVVSPEKTIGVRIPRHPFADIVEETGVPLVTTSVNLKDGPPVTKITNIPEQIKKSVDFIVDAGTIEGSASRIFDMRTEDVKALMR
ncbi:MAG: threonylcarbamoyl-AMP synthase [Candidatus Aenigmarchaeota archaeon]|nr:threonylcarbamoyl-AMP synthase [Candidatus Aenigmarchaeota archaeon]